MFLEYLQPSVDLLGLRIDEPVTTATDTVMAAVCLIAYWGIGHRNFSGILSMYLRIYFFSLGMGALTGGFLGHAFLYLLDPRWKLVSWLLIIFSVALLGQFLLNLSSPLLGRRTVRLITLINLFAMTAASYLTLQSLLFKPVAWYSAFGIFLLVGSLTLILILRTGNRHLLNLMAAVVLGIVSALIFSFEWGFSPWFNHRDLSHVLLSISAWFIYRGSVRILQGPSLFPPEGDH